MREVFTWNPKFNISQFEVIDENYESKIKVTKNGYKISKKTIYHYLSKEHTDYLIREIRNLPLDKTIVSGYLGHGVYIKDTKVRVYINMAIAELLDRYSIRTDTEFRKEFIFRGSYAKGKPKKYFEKILSKLYKEKIDNFVVFLPHLLSDIKAVFYKISLICNSVVSMDHSYYDYIKAYQEIESFRNIMDTRLINTDMTPFEIERISKDVVKLFKEEINVSPITDFFKAGVKINEQQLQSMLVYGLVPDPLAKNMAKCMQPITGGMLNGIELRSDLFVLETIGRLCNVLNKSEIKIPGLTTKRLLMAVMNVRLNVVDTRETLDECSDDDYKSVCISIKINSKEDLEFFKYKYFLTKDNKWDYIDTDRLDLIGQTLQIRTFMLCKGENVICKHCFGYNTDFFRDTEVSKNSLVTFIVTVIAAVLQGVISLEFWACKTILFAWTQLVKLTLLTYNGDIYKGIYQERYMV